MRSVEIGLQEVYHYTFLAMGQFFVNSMGWTAFQRGGQA